MYPQQGKVTDLTKDARYAGIGHVKEVVHAPAPVETQPARLNEVNVMYQLQRSGAVVTINTVVSKDPIVGPIVWHDINNVALAVDGKHVVCSKSQIETWSYSDAHIA